MGDNQLAKWVAGFSGKRIAVLGDLMLDCYVWGHAARISQEAPVPVVAVSRRSEVPGGAANVARNVVSLGGQAVLFGVVGSDGAGDELMRILRQAGVDVSAIVKDTSRPTTTKTRILASNQQMLRVDEEKTDDVSQTLRNELLLNLRRQLKAGTIDALIIEDYAKGVLDKEFMDDATKEAVACRVPVALDPHSTHPFDVKGLTLMTPNRAEAFALCGAPMKRGIGDPLHDPALLEVGHTLCRRWNPTYLLITLGGEGMELFNGRKKPPLHIPTRARQVFDVSGAGDTVMATMVLAQVAGAPAIEAAALANHAAGVVVARVGTAAIEVDDLLAELN